jgi:uncharacterized protein YjbI with pentapeptide repeats
MSRSRSSLLPRVLLLSAEAFEARIKAHEAFTRGRPGGARGDLRYAVARGMRCDRRRLADADFTGADLTGSTFVGSDMARVSLYCANLTRCDLRGASLFRADLRGGTYSGAKLAGANLDQADMRAAVLCIADDALGLKWVGPRTSMNGTTANGADMSDAVAVGVDFTNCSMRGALLRNANLKNANFTDANLDGVDLAGARLSGVQLQGAILTNVDTGILERSGIRLTGCVLDPGAAAIARLGDIRKELERSEVWAKTNGKDGAPACLDGFDLRPAKSLFTKQLLAGMTARASQGISVDFSGAQLQGAIFDDADLRGASFKGADLRGASFLRARLSHAVFEGADLSALEGQGGSSRVARFDGAELTGTGLVHRPARESEFI